MDLDTIPVMDALTHVTEDGKWYDTAHDASEERLLGTFDRRLRKALLVGMEEEKNNHLLSVSRRHPDKFIPIAAIELKPGDSTDRLEEKIIDFKRMGFRGIKIHPRRLNMNLANPCISRAVGLAGRHRLVSLLCTVHRAPLPPLKRPLYDILHQICDENRNSKLVLLHGGYFEVLATSEIIIPFEHVLLDLSFTIIRFQDTHIVEDIRYLFKAFDRRLCLGSDFPEYTMKEVLRVIEKKGLHRDLSREKLENIFSRNLQEFFNESRR